MVFSTSVDSGARPFAARTRRVPAMAARGGQTSRSASGRCPTRVVAGGRVQVARPDEGRPASPSCQSVRGADGASRPGAVGAVLGLVWRGFVSDMRVGLRWAKPPPSEAQGHVIANHTTASVVDPAEAGYGGSRSRPVQRALSLASARKSPDRPGWPIAERVTSARSIRPAAVHVEPGPSRLVRGSPDPRHRLFDGPNLQLLDPIEAPEGVGDREGLAVQVAADVRGSLVEHRLDAVRRMPALGVAAHLGERAALAMNERRPPPTERGRGRRAPPPGPPARGRRRCRPPTPSSPVATMRQSLAEALDVAAVPRRGRSSAELVDVSDDAAIDGVELTGEPCLTPGVAARGHDHLWASLNGASMRAG